MHLLSEGQIECFCFHLETQLLPDLAASTLLWLLKPRLLSLREHLGGIMQIFPHRYVDMWGACLNEPFFLGGMAESSFL